MAVQKKIVGRVTSAMPKQFKVGDSISRWSQSATSDKIFSAFIASWGIPVALAAILILINFRALPNQVPLFYSRVWGEDQLANKMFLYLPVAGAFLLGTFNLGLAISFHERDKVISYLLAGTASLVSALSFLSILNILRLML